MMIDSGPDSERPKGEDEDAMGEATDAPSGAGYGNHAVEEESAPDGDAE